MKQLQIPDRRIFFSGDSVRFILQTEIPGRAFLRTNLNNAMLRRKELIEYTEKNLAVSGLSWHDLPMRKNASGDYEIHLGLLENGIFEAKCFIIPDDKSPIRWVDGSNVVIKVETQSNVGGNSIYSAFVRLFDFNLPSASPAQLKNAEKLLEENRYNVIPKSGTFRNLIGELDFIFNKLKCKIIQLLPIHPTPSVYGKMGEFGSPFAALDYFAVNPELAVFDEKATPMEQFSELVDAVHQFNGRIFLDIPVNHTGWASKLQSDHPEYFVRKNDGTFVSPGAWGVVWADLCKLNYTKKELHIFMAEVFLFWCRHDVDGFRCDAGYMLPIEAWEYIVAKVRHEFPNTVFMLEGLGGPPDTQSLLLEKAGLDWAYSEIFQNYSKSEIENYSRYMQDISTGKGALVNFAETHDNSRLAEKGKIYASMRTTLCALLSPEGAFGFANGVEFFATEKIDVHKKTSLNWNNPENQVALIGRLNSILQINAAFFAGSRFEFHDSNLPDIIYFSRRNGDAVLEIFLNLNCEKSNVVNVTPGKIFYDLISGNEIKGGEIVLAPGMAAVLSEKHDDLLQIIDYQNSVSPEVPLVKKQKIRELILRLYFALNPERILGEDFDFDFYSGKLLEAPLELCRIFSGERLAPVVKFNADTDCRRHVLIGTERLLLVESTERFRIFLKSGATNCDSNYSFQLKNGGYFTVLRIPESDGVMDHELTLEIVVFSSFGKTVKRTGHLLQLEKASHVRLKLRHEGHKLPRNMLALHSNILGTMSAVRAKWGTLDSKYDALLAGNCNKDFPVDRTVMFSRCRAWLVYNDFSQELDYHLQKSFTSGLDNVSKWEFEVPIGQGAAIEISFVLYTSNTSNAIRLEFIRHGGDRPGLLASEIPVKIILRPDVDDRISHTLTKAYTGAEQSFNVSVKLLNDGFVFGPAPDRQLKMTVKKGRFVRQNEWRYMVNLPEEQYYGLEDKTDVFSPGYFEFELNGGEKNELFAGIETSELPESIEYAEWNDGKFDETLSIDETIRKAIRHFVVKRNEFHTIIAGFPWFLDWGRDTLIALRGLLDCGYFDEGSDIIRQFAKFEKSGTIPNVIRGNDDSNRDTADAPLWLFVAVKDYIEKTGDDHFLESICGNRTLLAVLESIIENYLKGTPNRIKVDPESMLVYSPSHFTWMDTNYPAGTPREGYAVEIQSLWYAALDFMGQFKSEYIGMAKKVEENFIRYFYIPELNRFSDCLHSSGGPAKSAVGDDHIRPNQLFALTLGMVKGEKYRECIVNSCSELVVPGALRSLADRKVEYRLPVYLNYRLLNNPEYPYIGRYNGPEDTSRKVAYHNGTAWCWVFPSYCEAIYLLGGEPARERALTLLLSVKTLFDNGVPGQLPEILEGDYPHKFGGCPAQAWSLSEFARVYKILTGSTKKLLKNQSGS